MDIKEILPQMLKVSNDYKVVLPKKAFFDCYVNSNSLTLQDINDVTIGANVMTKIMLTDLTVTGK